MDGASKFVKGDAIAGIIITIINIFGGIIIGVVMLKMPIATALTTYVRLTVGDGLVSQIPALLISTASGILVTRSSSTTNLGTQITDATYFISKGFCFSISCVNSFSMYSRNASSCFYNTCYCISS